MSRLPFPEVLITHVRLIVEAHRMRTAPFDFHRIFRVQRGVAGNMDGVPLEAAVSQGSSRWRAVPEVFTSVRSKRLPFWTISVPVINVNLLALNDEPARQEGRRGLRARMFSSGGFRRKALLHGDVLRIESSAIAAAAASVPRVALEAQVYALVVELEPLER